MKKFRTIGLASLALGLCGSRTTLARETDAHEVQPERPTVATHAGTVAPGWIEVEFGAERDRYADDSLGAGLPAVVKIGLRPRVQSMWFIPVCDRRTAHRCTQAIWQSA